jgi:hypothetical protein
MVQNATAALENLAAALPGDRYATMLTCGTEREPKLCVVNRDLPSLASDVYAHSGWFWWPWAERIAATSDPQAAARQVSAALHGRAPALGQR